MSFFKNGETSIYYEEHGSGMPIVLLHGVGGNHASWFHQIVALRDSYRVIIFDARGFGNTMDTEGLGRDGFLDDLDGLLLHLKVDQAVLLGQSMGGGTCVSFSCTYPHRVRALVLADTLVGLEVPSENVDELARIRREAQDLSQIERVLGATTRRQKPAVSMLYSQIASFNRVNFKTIKGDQPQWSIASLAKTGLPILFVAGSEDVLYPPHLIAAVHSRIPKSQLSVIEGVGHSAFYEDPSRFNEILKTWLAKL